MPSAVSGCPAQAMNRSVGPLSTEPRTSGETATTGAEAARSASATPSTRRIGPIEITGFDGPITIACARSSASSTSGVACADSAPRTSTPSTGPSAPLRIMNCWKPSHSPRALGEPARALEADREVAVAEVEPDVLAELAQGVHDDEGVIAQAPAAIVD